MMSFHDLLVIIACSVGVFSAGALLLLFVRSVAKWFRLIKQQITDFFDNED